jgi:hypothetical protein
MENLIKLHKAQLASDRMSCHSATANQVRLVLDTAAFWLMHGVRAAIPQASPLASYREMGLQLRNKMPKRRAKAKLREDRQSVTRPNETWAMDFVHDQLVIGRKLRVLTIIDTFSLLARDRTSVQLPRP